MYSGNHESLQKRISELEKENSLLKENVEEALLITQERLLAAQALAHVGNWEIDLRTKELWESDETYRIYGVDRNDPNAPANLVQALVFPEDRPRLRSTLHNLLDGGKYEVEFQITRFNDGEIRTLFSKAELLFDVNGTPIKVVGVNQDITNRKMIENALLESKRRMVTAQALAHVGNWEIDLLTGNVWASAEAFRIYGIERVTSVLPLKLVQEMVLPEYRERMDFALENVLNGGKYEEEFKIKRKSDNELRFLYSKAELIQDAKSKALKVAGVIQDITERKISEEKLQESELLLRAVFEQAPIGIAINSNTGYIQMRNSVLENMVNAHQHPHAGFNWEEITHPDDLQEDLNQFKRLQSGEIDKYKLKKRYLLPNNEVIWVNMIVANVKLENNEHKCHIVMVEDITEQKIREDEIVHISYHDKLTDLNNRRFFEDQLIRLDTEEHLPLSIMVADINGLKLVNDVFGHIEGDKIIKAFAANMKKICRPDDMIARWGGDEIIILLPNTPEETVEEIFKRIDKNIYDDSQKILRASISVGYATKTDAKSNMTDILKNAEDFMYRRKLLEGSSLRSSIVSSIITTLRERYIQTEEHSERLKSLCRSTGTALKISESKLDDLELLAVLHDIGKIAIKDAIINKDTKLTDSEWHEMKRHSEIGYHIAKATPELHQISDLILAHHERWDGTGYPKGLKGEEIPHLSRIVAVVDAFDAMTNDRPYRKAKSVNEALDEIERCAGTQFDPHIASVFCGVFKRHLQIKGDA